MEDRGHLLPFPQAPDGIELRHLRAFVAVAEELNFGRAADRLYISQSALSRQIRGLEQLLGCELLRRSTHRVELTLAGEALLDRSRAILRDIDEAVSATLTVGNELLGRISKLWEPMVGLLASEADLQEARAAAEEIMAQTSPPLGTRVRPVSAAGVSSLLVSATEDAPATVLYLHGGGYVLGSAFGYQPHAGAIATAAQTGVLVPDYRLAPEHPFPAALNDALSAYRWLLDRGIAPERVTVTGDSSGGGLVLSLLLTLSAQHLPQPGAVVLMCPWLDLALRLERERSDVIAPLVGDDEVRNCAAMYLAGHPLDDPVVSPLSADLTGLPPMLIQAATGDARLADARALAARARTYGSMCAFSCTPLTRTHSISSGRSCQKPRTRSKQRERSYARPAAPEWHPISAATPRPAPDSRLWPHSGPRGSAPQIDRHVTAVNRQTSHVRSVEGELHKLVDRLPDRIVPPHRPGRPCRFNILHRGEMQAKQVAVTDRRPARVLVAHLIERQLGSSPPRQLAASRRAEDSVLGTLVDRRWRLPVGALHVQGEFVDGRRVPIAGEDVHQRLRPDELARTASLRPDSRVPRARAGSLRGRRRSGPPCRVVPAAL